jgi:ATP-binding protein involved in chromosome partitioning
VERIAVPVVNEELSMHFGHCEHFAIVDVENGEIKSINYYNPPQHAPGVYPQWLAQEGVNTIITGGMGVRAQELFTQNGIKVVFSGEIATPETLISKYLSGGLKESDNTCDHDEHPHENYSH